ncbi:hypothetical protein [Miltoncostaea marina]|uniref:hypothetical protein n=1 Tax=Miltoncostaea marina TaxID=2843215 RepID=UPI001C3DC6B7|nr:hypothetical protein [Miltoncostaea marina]
MRLRRPLITVTAAVPALVAALAIPAVAATPAPKPPAPKAGAWTHVTVQRGYDLAFRVAGGRVTKVVANVLEDCTGETVSRVATFAPDASYPVKGGRFGRKTVERFDGLTARIDFRGRFTSRTRATGTLKMETIVAGSVCTTYTLRWTARRR